MSFVYLGFTDDALQWILAHILDPIFSWLAELLNSLFSWLFGTILAPLLKSVLIPLASILGKMLLEALAGVLYSMMSTIWKLLDTMEEAFDIFMGISKVTDTQNPQAGPVTLLEALYNIKSIRTAFLYILVVALVLTLLFTIYAVAKSIFDLEPDNPRTVSRVMTGFMKACIQFMMVPLLVLFMIRFSGVMITTVNNSISANEQSSGSIGSTLFVVSSLDAAKNESYNISTATGDHLSQIGGEKDPVRYPYYTNGMKGAYHGSDSQDLKTYWNTKQVEKDFNYSKFDFLVGIGMSVFMFIIMVSVSMVFIQRMFDMLVLYVTSPFFVSMIPLDDGERFKQWRNMFLGKAVTGFGSIVAMRMYLIIVPMIVANRIQFGDLMGESVETTYIMKMLFLLGGAWAVTRCGSMITSLIGSAAGSMESVTSAVGVGMGVSAMKAVGTAAVFAGGKVFGKGDKKDLNGNGKAEEGSKTGEESGEDKDDTNRNQALDTVLRSDSKIPGLSRSDSLVSGRESRLSARSVSNAEAEDDKKKAPLQKTKKFLGMPLKTNRDGKYRPNINMGKLFSNTYGADGSHSVNILGFQYRSGANGKMNKLSVFGVAGGTWDKNGKGHFNFNVGVAKRSVASDGSRNFSIGGGLYSRSYDKDQKLTNYSNFGVEHTRNTKTGEMYCNRNWWSGLKKVQDEDGAVHTTAHWGFHYAPDGNGDYHCTGGWGMKQEFMVNQEGKAECVGRSFLGRSIYNAASRKEELSKLSINNKKKRF